MRTLAIAALAAVLLVSSSGLPVQGKDRFQSVSGEFAREVLSTLRSPDSMSGEMQGNDSRNSSTDLENLGGTQKSNVTVEEEGGNSDLWSWGSAPKGSIIVDGELEEDPSYVRYWLNTTANWLGEASVGSYGGVPVYAHVNPKTGKTIYSYIDPLTGKVKYSDINPSTGTLY